MSKMGQAVFEGQEFAQSYYNEPSCKFEQLAVEAFGKSTVEYNAAIEEFTTISQELTEHFSSEPFVPAEVDADGIPY